MNDKLVKSLKENPVKYARLLGFSLLTDLHNEWIKDMVWHHIYLYDRTNFKKFQF